MLFIHGLSGTISTQLGNLDRLQILDLETFVLAHDALVRKVPLEL
jgi:hypothetical protein